MVEVSEKVMIAAGLRPGDEAEAGAEAFTEADEQPISLD